MSRDVEYPEPPLVRIRNAFARRLHEREFWAIQAAVILISVIHIVVEAGVVPLGTENGLPALHHIPVILYLAPVAYAGLIYGWEGGVLTGLWAGALSSINVVLFSLSDYEWVLEGIFVVVVIGMGVVMALPVERERKQRRRAETAAHQLETLNELATAAVPARTPIQAADAVLSELVSLMNVDDAGLVLWRHEQAEPVVRATYRSDSTLSHLLEERSILDRRLLTSRSGDLRAPIGVPITTENMTGFLVVASGQGLLLDSEIRGFLATVGSQLAVRVENAMLLEQEQVTLSTYIKLVTEAQEEERKRLARDLHDGPAQRLAVLVRNLEGEDMEEPGSTGHLHESASEILGELRRVARDQRPTLLDDLGIVPALEWLRSESNERSDITISLDVEGSAQRLDPETEVAFYRIAQEALRNAEQHSGASLIEIAIRFGEDRVVLTITDDGDGFQVPGSPGGYLRSGRLGLMGMHERAQLVGGSLDIDSSPGNGTVVTATISRSARHRTLQ